jgi:hypothetical protein
MDYLPGTVTLLSVALGLKSKNKVVLCLIIKHNAMKTMGNREIAPPFFIRGEWSVSRPCRSPLLPLPIL